jgi:hypothetical protein
MADTPRTSTWMSRLRKRVDRQLTDWGDLGTAIGMEMALVPPSVELETAHAKPAPSTEATARRWWVRRR